MILESSIADFLSFRDKVTFSMLANATSGLDDNYIVSNDRRIGTVEANPNTEIYKIAEDLTKRRN